MGLMFFFTYTYNCILIIQYTVIFISLHGILYLYFSSIMPCSVALLSFLSHRLRYKDVLLFCQALSERLFYYIAVSLLPHDTLCELEAAVEAGRALSPILQWHKHPNDYFSREAQTLYFNSLRTYWQELIDLTR